MAADLIKSSLGLTSSNVRIEIPFIKVKIGDYTFGAYAKKEAEKTAQGWYTRAGIEYPNYIQSLKITKINGQVNQYELSLIYPIGPGDDPNFFEKVFSSVSVNREIEFSYGDMSVPEYIYKKEKAIINRVGNTFDMNTSRINYTVSAVSACMLGYSGSHFFPSYFGKPSELIKSLLASNKDDLKALFPGMVNSELVEQLKLIADDDKEVQLDAQENCSTMDYIKYCVENMIPTSTLDISSKVGAFYIFTVHDENEAEIIGNTNLRDLGGAYFKVSKVNKKEEHSDAYVLNLGYPSGTFVTNFSVENNENYSIFYNYAEKLDTTNYVDRVNLETGTVEKEFSPRLTSKNDRYLTTQSAQVWWTKVADYPISASITIRGLLRPALLMQYLKLNVLFYGQKHVASGLYIITKQIDEISGSGYKTTLGLTKISASTSAIIE